MDSNSKVYLILIVAAISTIVWVISLFVRKKDSKKGAVLSWTALFLMAIAVVLYHVFS
ncbi:MAG: hypothetical protein IJ150_05230 [Bacteroidales bacterium]|nr:hypothetical protein [Bacteroidales bacterium]